MSTRLTSFMAVPIYDSEIAKAQNQVSYTGRKSAFNDRLINDTSNYCFALVLKCTHRKDNFLSLLNDLHKIRLDLCTKQNK